MPLWHERSINWLLRRTGAGGVLVRAFQIAELDDAPLLEVLLGGFGHLENKRLL